jgi:hypothetical protein
MLEARARARGGSAFAWGLRVLAETLLAKAVIARGKPVGGFDPERYKAEIGTNTDFCRHDRTLAFVVDCALDAVEPVQRLVDQRARAEGFEWGAQVSDTALMTCLVTSEAEGVHVHFVDGGGGGYTSAATRMKAARAAARTTA